MTELRAQQYRDANAMGPYPFADDAARVSKDGLITLGVDLLQDAILYPAGAAAGLQITEVDCAGGGVALWIGTPAAPRLAVAGFDARNPPAAVPVRDALGRAAGLLIADPNQLAAAQTWPAGVHAFAAGAAAFVPTVVVPTPQAQLAGIVTGGDGALLVGDVWLVGEYGVTLRHAPPYGTTPVIEVDVVGDALALRAACAGTPGLFATPLFVRTINGVAPDVYGNFTIAVGDHDASDTVLRIVPSGADSLLMIVHGTSTGAP